jgi:hypothetical protein
VRIEVPKGALAEEVSLVAVAATGTPEWLTNAYALGPDGLIFDKPVRVVFRYAENRAFRPESLRILTEVVDGWTAIPHDRVDTTERTVAGWTTHFSKFGVVEQIEEKSCKTDTDCGEEQCLDENTSGLPYCVPPWGQCAVFTWRCSDKNTCAWNTVVEMYRCSGRVCTWELVSCGENLVCEGAECVARPCVGNQDCLGLSTCSGSKAVPGICAGGRCALGSPVDCPPPACERGTLVTSTGCSGNDCRYEKTSCGPGKTCELGTCVAYPCTTASDCPMAWCDSETTLSGYACIDGRCANKKEPCPVGKACRLYQCFAKCASDVDCAPPSCSDDTLNKEICEEGVCVPDPVMCYGFGLVCRNGACEEVPDGGGADGGVDGGGSDATIGPETGSDAAADGSSRDTGTDTAADAGELCVPCSPSSAPYDSVVNGAIIEFDPVAKTCRAITGFRSATNSVTFFYGSGSPTNKVDVQTLGTLLSFSPCGTSCEIRNISDATVATSTTFGAPVTFVLRTVSGQTLRLTATLDDRTTGSLTGASVCFP